MSLLLIVVLLFLLFGGGGYCGYYGYRRDYYGGRGLGGLLGILVVIFLVGVLFGVPHFGY